MQLPKTCRYKHEIKSGASPFYLSRWFLCTNVSFKVARINAALFKRGVSNGGIILFSTVITTGMLMVRLDIDESLVDAVISSTSLELHDVDKDVLLPFMVFIYIWACVLTCTVVLTMVHGTCVKYRQ